MIKKAERNKEKKNKKIKQGFTKHDESRTTNIALRTVNKAKVLCVCVFVIFLFFFSFATPPTHKKKKWDLTRGEWGSMLAPVKFFPSSSFSHGYGCCRR